MVVGNGLLAQAFSSGYSERKDVCIYAAGVSNSNCSDVFEFSRERERLIRAMTQEWSADAFVYFSTCSVVAPEPHNQAYIEHKLAMEAIVRGHDKHLILRLPQVAGRTENSHTLLNFLYACIAKGEVFELWLHARRNFIDISDVVMISQQLIDNDRQRNTTLNVANTENVEMAEVVAAMECAVGKKARYKTVEYGTEYHIDTTGILPVLDRLGIDFGSEYLGRVIRKYY